MLWLKIYLGGMVVVFIIRLLSQDADQSFFQAFKETLALRWNLYSQLIFWPIYLLISIGVVLLFFIVVVPILNRTAPVDIEYHG